MDRDTQLLEQLALVGSAAFDPVLNSLTVVSVKKTNLHSTVFETWKTIKSDDDYGPQSVYVSNAWTDDLWILFFDALSLPADGALTIRRPVPVPMGQGNEAVWDPYTTGFATGLVAVLSSTQPTLTAVLIVPTITGDGGVLSVAAGQGFRGVNNTNTDVATGPAAGNGNAYLYGEITVPGGNATLTVFKDAAHLQQVAHGALVGNLGGVITLVDDASSKITGPFTIAAGVGAHAAVVFEIATGGFFDAEVLP